MNRCKRKRFAIIRAQKDCVTVESQGLAITIDSAETPYVWEVREFLAGANPDLILLDLALPISVGANLLRIIGDSCPGTSFVGRVESASSNPSYYSIESTGNGLFLMPLKEIRLEGTARAYLVT